jgi:hypothetical protein
MYCGLEALDQIIIICNTLGSDSAAFTMDSEQNLGGEEFLKKHVDFANLLQVLFSICWALALAMDTYSKKLSSSTC